MQIDHDPEEPKRDPDKSLWPWAFLLVCFFAIQLWLSSGIDWPSALMGSIVTFAASFWYVDFMRYDFFKSWRETVRKRRP